MFTPITVLYDNLKSDFIFLDWTIPQIVRDLGPPPISLSILSETLQNNETLQQIKDHFVSVIINKPN